MSDTTEIKNTRTIKNYLKSFFDLELVTKIILYSLSVIFLLNILWSMTYYYNKYDKNSEGLIFLIFNFVGLGVCVYLGVFVLNDYTNYEDIKTNEKYLIEDRVDINEKIRTQTIIRRKNKLFKELMEECGCEKDKNGNYIYNENDPRLTTTLSKIQKEREDLTKEVQFNTDDSKDGIDISIKNKAIKREGEFDGINYEDEEFSPKKSGNNKDTYTFKDLNPSGVEIKQDDIDGLIKEYNKDKKIKEDGDNSKILYTYELCKLSRNLNLDVKPKYQFFPLRKSMDGKNYLSIFFPITYSPFG